MSSLPPGFHAPGHENGHARHHHAAPEFVVPDDPKVHSKKDGHVVFVHEIEYCHAWWWARQMAAMHRHLHG